MSELSVLFVIASRKKYTFPSVRGPLNVEQLWDLPLSGKVGADLDSVAKSVNQSLKAVEEESFVETKDNPEKTDLANKLELVKFIIATKQAENKALADRAERRRKREELLEVLAAKDAEELSKASRDDILKKLAELDA